MQALAEHGSERRGARRPWERVELHVNRAGRVTLYASEAYAGFCYGSADLPRPFVGGPTPSEFLRELLEQCEKERQST